jgi:two-component system, OmpR family, phosphate regulon sensor histidine kinase PhoR
MRSLRTSSLRSFFALALGIILLFELVAFIVSPEHIKLFMTVGIAALCVAIIVSIWFSNHLVAPLKTLLPVIDSEGRLELAGNPVESNPVEVRQLSERIAQIAEKQRKDFLARQRLERVRSEFLANVSHELRTPVFAVQGLIETLLNGAIDDPAVNRDFLERAHTQAGRLNSLLNDLIDISRIESGEMRMSFRQFDIQPMLREFALEMQPQAEQKEIELYFTGNILPHHEVSVFADKERIRQVLINLVDNAIKYSEEGASIKIELLDEVPTSQNVTIGVTDTGIGISAEHLPRLFERFYRVDKDRARSAPGGTGLGLAIVKHLVDAHGGKISVTSERSKGSTFQFTLQKQPHL